MYRVLFTGNTLSDDKISELKSKQIRIEPAPIDLSEDDLINRLQGCVGYILGGEEIANKRVINAANQLKVLGFYGAGYERYVDIEAATQRKLIVTYTPKANAYTVAEFTVGLILDLVKKISYMNARTKKGIYERNQVWNLQGKTLGIIGMGAIGSYVARIMHNGFGMDVVYVSRSQKPQIEKELSAQKVDLLKLLKTADVVSLHASYNDDTVGMFGKKEFNLMKTKAVLINTSRAELVDGHALCAALIDGKFAAAAYDCYYTEPVPEPENDEYHLLSLPDDKFVITPHTAFNSIDAVKAMETMVVNSVVDVLEGRKPKNMVNPEVF